MTPPEYTRLPAEPLEGLADRPSSALIDTTPSIGVPRSGEVLAQLHHVDGPVERYALGRQPGPDRPDPNGPGPGRPSIALRRGRRRQRRGRDDPGAPGESSGSATRKDALGVWQIEGDRGSAADHRLWRGRRCSAG
ncbi:MAG: hypothetical protein R3F54_01750 [Alphaproteobacteria bacterium]